MNLNNQQNLTAFFSTYSTRRLKKGEVIYKQGEEVKYVGMIKSGYMRAFFENKAGDELTLPVLNPLFYVTLISTVLEKPTAYTLQAMTNTEVWLAPEAEFFEFFKKDLNLHMEVMKTILWGFSDLTVNMARIMSGDAYERVATTLDFIFHYYSQTEGGKKELDLPLPHRLIGSMTGLSRETVTLQILKMTKKGIVSTKNRRIKLMSEEKLQAATGR
jgi:CRP/FNR family transcriptional regulator